MIEINYRCKKCEHEFSEKTSETFVRTSMPSCPACKNTDGVGVSMVKKIATKIDKV